MEEIFKDAQWRVLHLNKRPSNENLLSLYGLFKQASAGDVQGSRPGMLDIAGRAKYDAWALHKGLTKEQAMKEYVDLVDRLVKEDP